MISQKTNRILVNLAKIEMDQLKSFIDQLKALLKQIVDKDLSESDAYNIGAEIEAALDEANFTKVIKVNDEDIAQKIKRLDLDNKKHGMILINYAKGVK